MYNIILYSAPFVLCQVYDYEIITQNMFFCSTYELIASKLQLVVQDHIQNSPQNLTFMLKMQLRLEQYMLLTNNYRDLYEKSILYLQCGRRISVLAASVVTPSYLIYFTYPRLGSLGLMGTTQIAPTETIFYEALQSMDRNRVLEILRDMIFYD